MMLSANSCPTGTLCTWEVQVQCLEESCIAAKQLRGALGTFGYVISRAGAVKMLDFMKESDKPIDHLDSAIAFGRILAFMYSPRWLNT